MAVAFAALCESPLRIRNSPDIVETRVLGEILARHGGGVRHGGDETAIDPSAVFAGDPLTVLASDIHGVGYLIPASLRKAGSARVHASAGCQIGAGAGSRPIEHYAEIARKFGVTTVVESGGVLAAYGDRWRGAEIDLARYVSSGRAARTNFYSGATKMAILMAAGASTPSTLRNPYRKPDVDALLECLLLAGVHIVDATSDEHDELLIVPPSALAFAPNCAVDLVRDPIELLTIVVAAALTATGPVVVEGLPETFRSALDSAEFALLAAMGVRPQVIQDGLRVDRAPSIRPIRLRVEESGSIFSDSQPFFALLAACANGRSEVVDEVWPDRFAYAGGLRRLGFPMEFDGRRLHISGGGPLPSTTPSVTAPDLRGAAVLMTAALARRGSTRIGRAEHLDRGYSDLAGTFSALGADVERLPT